MTTDSRPRLPAASRAATPRIRRTCRSLYRKECSQSRPSRSSAVSRHSPWYTPPTFSRTSRMSAPATLCAFIRPASIKAAIGWRGEILQKRSKRRRRS